MAKQAETAATGKQNIPDVAHVPRFKDVIAQVVM